MIYVHLVDMDPWQPINCNCWTLRLFPKPSSLSELINSMVFWLTSQSTQSNRMLYSSWSIDCLVYFPEQTTSEYGFRIYDPPESTSHVHIYHVLDQTTTIPYKDPALAQPSRLYSASYAVDQSSSDSAPFFLLPRQIDRPEYIFFALLSSPSSLIRRIAIR